MAVNRRILKRGIANHIIFRILLTASFIAQATVQSGVTPRSIGPSHHWHAFATRPAETLGRDRTARTHLLMTSSDTDSESNFPSDDPSGLPGSGLFLHALLPAPGHAAFTFMKTNKASAQGDFQGANAASRQALWLSVLSIVFGIITYICAIAALISYLSGKPP
ncbi:synapse differentiation-inducing gene protein 1-like protein [Lates japonicus]|uniref:Synapse differentiation-inducing gene protein 1-like protein n=1 Tax=Lates japonicus TaxID=270547 RepID=A0AAD3M798_LATJO|nr:synapse differentiation-inducing gene protein 1-like protein [Lates japonicus]